MRWSSQIQTGFHVSRLTWGIRYAPVSVSPTGLSPCAGRLSMTGFDYRHWLLNAGPSTPEEFLLPGLASSPFARHY